MQDYENERWCYNCHSNRLLASHHCIEGSGRRQKSEKYGLKVLLCMDCHTGKNGVHNGNVELMRTLREEAQRAFERYHRDKQNPREYFRKEFGLSFL
jgi:hypothetical protein